MDSRSGCRSDAPHRGGALVAQQGSWAACEHGGKPMPVPGKMSMTDCIDAAMEAMQPARACPSLNRRGAEAKLEQLPVSDHAMLPLRQLRDRTVGWLPSTSAIDLERNHLGHGGDGGMEARARVCRIGRGCDAEVSSVASIGFGG